MLKRASWLKPITEQKSTLKSNSFLTGLAGGVVSLLLLSGLVIYFTPRSSWQESTTESESSATLNDSVFTDLSDRSKAAQISLLRNLVKEAESSQARKPSLDVARARYVLAVESLQKQQFPKALAYLQELETDYPQLASHILWRKAQAYQKIAQTDKVAAITQQVIDNYADSPVIPDLLTLLGRKSEADVQYLAEKFPYHPYTQRIAQQQLKVNPKHWQSLLLIARYQRGTEINAIRDRLVLKHPEHLSESDWQAIADGYWQGEDHRKAADAYRFSPASPQNLYRIARGFHENGNFAEAKLAYKRLDREYHDAQETGQALVYLARLSAADEAIKYLEQAISLFPERAAQALINKARIHEKYDKIKEARSSRKQALENYPDSAATLNYLWKQSRQLAFQGDYNGAWQQGKAIAQTRSLESDPKAIFWVGKWAKRAGETEGANRAFKRVIEIHPQSYYAWRAAVILGQDVGDFDNLRSIQPDLQFQTPYEPLPFGSETLQELYLLGQYRDAWVQLQAEIANPQQLTVSEQFTEGVLLVKQGQYRAGIQHIWNLAQRESPLDQKQWRSLRQKDSYWYGLFPFPYHESIVTNARQQEINPLLSLSVMRKESTFDPKIDSHVGAVGLMQIIPRTADWIAQQADIPTYDLTQPADNISMGTWYLAHNHHRYENNSLYAIASYNAGTGNVNQWLRQFSLEDPDLFVEQIPFPETKDYVEGVFGNYWNYLRLYSTDK